MGVKLVALDIDGTIIPPDTPPELAYPSPRLQAAVRALSERGIAVVLASGRMFPGTSEIARHLGLTTPVICQQGCSVHLPDGRMIHEVPLARSLAVEICAYARSLGRPFEWFNPLRYVVSERTESSEEYARLSGIVAEYRPDPEDSGAVPTGVGVISTRAAAPAIHRHLVGLHPDALHVLDFPDVTVAVAAEANKGHALAMLCADFGIERHEVLAVGDSANDAPMLAWAGRGVAMAHSDRYALDAADEVLGADSELADVLEAVARGA